MSNSNEEFIFDDSNIEFKLAFELLNDPSRPNLFLTGKAGTGKTTFLKFVRDHVKRNTVVVAPTGVAAVNANGQTIHSFFQIPPDSIFRPDDNRLRIKSPESDTDKTTIYNSFKYNVASRDLIQALDLLIIDEISMVRCELLDVIDRILRAFRKGKINLPFGGVQILFIGDAFQLPPIAEIPDWEHLSKFYESPFFFDSLSYKKCNPLHIELKKIYRQKDEKFISLLNRIRTDNIDKIELENINSKLNPTFVPGDDQNYITLTTHKYLAKSTNDTKLQNTVGELIEFCATIWGNYPSKLMAAEQLLELKVGAQVMFVKNNWPKGYYNGMIGKITELSPEKIVVRVTSESAVKQQDILVELETWKNIRYRWNEAVKQIDEEIIGTFTQYPLRLAWAITVHKSQGLTFNQVVADVGAAFSYGQVYVALSRCTSFSGLVLKSKIPREAIKAHPRVIEFAESGMTSESLEKELKQRRANAHFSKSFILLKKGDYKSAFEQYVIAFYLKNDFRLFTDKWVSLIDKIIENHEIKTKKLKLSLDHEISNSILLQQNIKDSQKEILDLNNKCNTLKNSNKTLASANSDLKDKINIYKSENEKLRTDRNYFQNHNNLLKNRISKQRALIILLGLLFISGLSFIIYQNIKSDRLIALNHSLSHNVKLLKSDNLKIINEMKSAEASNNSNSTALQELSTLYPIVIKHISFIDKDTNSADINNSLIFKADDSFSLTPQITYDSYVQKMKYITLDYKIYTPTGILLSDILSPLGFTNNCSVLANSLSKSQNSTLTNFYLNCPSCEIGNYQFELWYNEKLLGSQRFTIIR